MLQKINNMTARQKRAAIIVSVLALLSVIFIICTVVDNLSFEVNTVTVESGRLPEAFDGYRIALISDLHNAEFGEGNEKLLSVLREAAPDIIAITGDIIDSRRTDTAVALNFASEAVMLAPCYYVPGNHESRIEEYPEFREALTELGVVVLENECATVSRDGETVTLIGLTDLSFVYKGDAKAVNETVTASQISELTDGGTDYTVLLAHRPAYFDIYAEKELDLVLSGHIHGGQVRLPFIGGLAGGEYLLFPKYDAGLYTDGNTNMVVSRGLGNSVIPIRVNNRPEVVLVKLKSAK